MKNGTNKKKEKTLLLVKDMIMYYKIQESPSNCQNLPAK